MKHIKLSLLVILLLLKTGIAFSQDTFEGHVITPEGAWCWFADPRALHYENEEGTIKSTYIGYIDIHGAIKATQYDYLTGSVQEVLIRSYFQPDDHNNPTFLVLPDERIMIFYSRHTDESCFYYRISKKPGDITTLGEEKKLVTNHNTTYPSAFILANDPEHIYLCWRGLSWHPTIARLTLPDENDDVSFNWGPKQIVQSTGARPYAKYVSNGTNKIYLTYTTGHPDNESPNFIYFNYINILGSDVTKITLSDVKGKTLSVVNDKTHPVNKSAEYVTENPNTIVDNSSYRDWTWQVSMDTEGKPIIAMVRISSDKTSHDYYYAKWNGSEWKKTFLANGGGHFHQTAGLEMCYSGGMSIDSKNSNEIYCSVPVTGTNGKVYEIIKYTVANDGTVTSEAVTKNSRKNNARPYSIPGAGDANLNLVWMHGDYYDWIVSSSRPDGYPTGINGNFKLPATAIELEKNLIKSEDFSSPITGQKIEDDILVSDKTTRLAIVTGSTATEFTVSVSPYISEGAYEAERIVRVGNIEYGLNGTTKKPFIKHFGQTEDINTIYESTNILGNSDVWKTTGRGTNGQWYTPTKLKFFSLTITFKNGTLRTYINGLLDQSIEISETMELNDVVVGGFEGWIESCQVYDRVLSQDEIKALAENLSSKIEFSEILAITIPEYIYSDIVMKSATSSGNAITWTSSDTGLVNTNGIVTFPQSPAKVSLTASLGELKKEFETTVMPRDIENNKLLVYEFEPSDEYTAGNVRYIKDKSGKGNDATVYGSAQINGVLDLTDNTASGFSTNGYVKAPDGIIDNLRSYSFIMKVKPESLSNAPRIYDFGSGSGNSVFGRANVLTAGLKYNGGTTIMLDSSEPLTVQKETFLAFTFDAKTKTTKIYVDGKQTASGTQIINEPYMLTGNNRNYIGRTQWWDQSVASDNVDFRGTIDDFYLFDIALTQEEITELKSSLSISGSVAIHNSDFRLLPTIVNANETVSLYSADTANRQSVKLDVFNSSGKIVQTHNPIEFPFNFNSPDENGLYIVGITNGSTRLAALKLIVR